MKRLFFLLGLIGILTSAWASHRDDDRRDEPRVILYEHADYQGDSLVLYPGDSLDNFSGQHYENGTALNDSVSSIRVEGGAQVIVYENARFRGATMRLTENVRDLTGRLMPDNNNRVSWNDRASSIRVEGTRRRPPERGHEIDYDTVIRRAFKDQLGRDPDETTIRRYRGYMIDQGWTEAMLRDQLIHGDEFRRESADRIVRRAYLDVLGREADESGMGHYRKNILERNWTEGDVRDDLRRSDEYKNRSKSPPSGKR
jgi:hypothetical protein